MGLDGKELIEYYLIVKYKKQVSERLLTRLKELRTIAKKNSDKMLTELVYSKKPILELIPKEKFSYGTSVVLFPNQGTISFNNENIDIDKFRSTEYNKLTPTPKKEG